MKYWKYDNMDKNMRQNVANNKFKVKFIVPRFVLKGGKYLWLNFWLELLWVVMSVGLLVGLSVCEKF